MMRVIVYIRLHWHRYHIPLYFLFGTIGILVFVRLSANWSVNEGAVWLVRALVENGADSRKTAHWTLSLTQTPISVSDAIDCNSQIERMHFLCTVLQLASNNRGGFQTPEKIADDPISTYFKGAVQLKNFPEKAIDTWAIIPNVSRFLAHQALKLSEQGVTSIYVVQIADASVATASGALPEIAPAYLALCQSFVEQSDMVQALDFCQKAENANDSWVNQVNVARIYINIQEYERALNIAMSLIEKGEGVAPALRIRGTVYAAFGDYENALADYSQLQRLGPIDRYTIYELAMIYYNMGDFSRAKELFEKLQLEFGDERTESYLKAIDTRLNTSP